MIHIAICDDEREMSEKIREMVSEFFRRKNMEIAIAQFSSGEELLNYDKTIDILFLDIQMKDINGIETARELRREKFNGMAYMEGGKKIPVSRLRSKEFSSVILQYMKEWRL